MNRVMIDNTLFCDLCAFFLLDKTDEETTARIRTALYAKADAMKRRDLYTRSLTAATEEEREAARQMYLDEVQLPEDFRW